MKSVNKFSLRVYFIFSVHDGVDCVSPSPFLFRCTQLAPLVFSYSSFGADLSQEGLWDERGTYHDFYWNILWEEATREKMILKWIFEKYITKMCITLKWLRSVVLLMLSFRVL